MHNVEILNLNVVKEMELSVERPLPKKGDREIARKVFSTLAGATKLRRMVELVGEHTATLIFVNTRQMAETLASHFRILGVNTAIHHGSLSKEARTDVEREFKGGEVKAIICTSSLELGIDIGSVDLVIQYNSPRQVSRLLQRIGRSGHQVTGRSKGIIIADNPDDILESLAIVRRARRGELEDITVFDKPYDVLIHQIVGLVLDLGSVRKAECYNIFKGSFVYSNLTHEEFDDILSIIKELRLLWEDEDGVLKKSRKSREYYYNNLSTIPYEKRYLVRDSVTRKSVGVLDEAFVAGLEYGDLIIFKGMPWHVVTSEDGELFVEPVSVVAGEVPRWVGEEIPVEFKIAREAGSLRRRGFKKYDADPYTKRLATIPIKKQVKYGTPLPSDKQVVVELFKDFIVINSTFGLKVNQTLASFFSTLLSARSGHSIGVKVDPYRIILQARGISLEAVEEVFRTDPSFIEPLLATSLKRTSLFKWKFVHTARRFGALSKEVDFKSFEIVRMINSWEDSPIYRETVKDIFTSNLDIEHSKKLLENIDSGRIGLKILRLKGPSPISELGMQHFSEVVLPERAERMIIRALRNRIDNRRLTLFCTYCSKWNESFIVKNIPEDVKCRKCGARMLAPLTYKPEESIKLYKKHKTSTSLTKEEKLDVKRIQNLGGLFLSYGRLLAEVVAARGVGSEAAKRILRDSYSNDEIYRNILKSERTYARTKRFWD